MQVRRPAADLASRIELFWSVRGDGRPGTAFHEFFPDHGANLVLRLSSSGCRLVLLGPVTDMPPSSATSAPSTSACASGRATRPPSRT